MRAYVIDMLALFGGAAAMTAAAVIAGTAMVGP